MRDYPSVEIACVGDDTEIEWACAVKKKQNQMHKYKIFEKIPCADIPEDSKTMMSDVTSAEYVNIAVMQHAQEMIDMNEFGSKDSTAKKQMMLESDNESDMDLSKHWNAK